MEAEGIAPIFVKLKVITLGLFVLWLGVNNFYYPIETAKPAWNLCLQVNKHLMMVAWFFVDTYSHWGVVYAQGMGHKGGILKAPEFFIQLLGYGIIWHQAEHLFIHIQ